MYGYENYHHGFGRRLKMTKRARYARAYAKRKARKAGHVTDLKQLQALANTNEVSIYKRRKDGMGFTKTPLSVKALKARLTRMKVSNFGMATVCPPGFAANPKWRRKPGQRQCLKVRSKPTLKQLQAIAKSADVSIYKRRKDDMGFTKTPLPMKALKARLTRMRVPH